MKWEAVIVHRDDNVITHSDLHSLEAPCFIINAPSHRCVIDFVNHHVPDTRGESFFINDGDERYFYGYDCEDRDYEVLKHETTIDMEE